MSTREDFIADLESTLNNIAKVWLRREEIISVLNCLMPDDIVKIWNSYVEWTGDSDSEIFPMREINVMFHNELTSEILLEFYDSIHDGEFNPSDDYYHIDKYGDFKSYNCPCEENSPVRYGELADYILEYRNDFGNTAIKEIIERTGGITIRERIKSFLKSLTDNQIVDIWNSYCDATNNSERYIFYMREINDFFEGEQTPFEIMYKMYPYIHEGLFNPSDDYFRIDPIGNYYSAELPSDLVRCIYDTLEHFIITRKQDFGIAAIAEIIKEGE